MSNYTTKELMEIEEHYGAFCTLFFMSDEPEAHAKQYEDWLKRNPEMAPNIKTYEIIYWLPNQSKLFSNPQCYVTTDKADFIRALETAQEKDYEIEFAGEV